jgi:hypothetical protein
LITNPVTPPSSHRHPVPRIAPVASIAGDPGTTTAAGVKRSAKLQEEKQMRRFMVHLVTEIDFVDGDEASDEAARNYKTHLAETVQNAAQGLLLWTIKDAQVESVSVTEIISEL